MEHMRVGAAGRRRLLYAGLLVGAAAFFRFAGYDGLMELRQSWRQESDLQHELQQLQEENAGIENGIKDLAPDGAAIERIARQDLGWAKPGEIVIKIPEKK